ncbi:hypothetical protein [Bradyrhizobium daqingense]|nr:hypothetical protein [Bradyrhizobium daqingense]
MMVTVDSATIESRCSHARHCEERSDEAIQNAAAVRFWIASLRSQ